MPVRAGVAAMIFSTDLVQRLDDGVPCRLPPTYVGVRRVRDNSAAVMIQQRVTPPATSFERDDCNRNHDRNRLTLRASNEGGGVVGDCAMACDPRTAVGRHPREDDSSAMPTTASPAASSTTGTAGMCYKIDGRRMTKAEKREMKHKLRLEARSVRREARARDVEERIRKEKAAKAERRQRRRADEKRRQRVQLCDETTKFESSHPLRPSAATELICDIVMNCDDDNKDEKKGSSTTYLANASTKNIDATSNSSSVRHDYLPAMLTSAATRVAQDLGMLLEPDDYRDRRNTTSSTTTTTNTTTTTTTIMDPILSAKWATALQQSMIPVETTREMEDIRPMAYRLMPEKWSRLCPDTLWMPPPAKAANFKVGKSADSDMTSTLLSSSSSLVQIRNSSSSSTTTETTTTTYDDDTYAIVSHLHNHSNIHITCGASFGCDYLLYDGRRTERHSFAGLRVYHCRGGVNKKKNGTAATATTNTNGDGGGGNDLELPMPSAYDMTGFVRTMNTARKIALIAMVVPIEEDGQHHAGNENNNDGKKDGVAEEDATMTTPMKSGNIRRIAIVDLALEKVLTAHAHVRKGNTAKRRTEEDAASGLAKKRWK